MLLTCVCTSSKQSGTWCKPRLLWGPESPRSRRAERRAAPDTSLRLAPGRPCTPEVKSRGGLVLCPPRPVPSHLACSEAGTKRMWPCPSVMSTCLHLTRQESPDHSAVSKSCSTGQDHQAVHASLSFGANVMLPSQGGVGTAEEGEAGRCQHRVHHRADCFSEHCSHS